MSRGLSAGEFTRQGSLNLAVYLANRSGAIINAPETPLINTFEFGLNEVLIESGRRLNIGNTIPGSQRTLKTFYGSLDEDGNLTTTVTSAGVPFTPGATDNAAIVRQANIPPGTVYVGALIDDQLAQFLPTPRRVRQNGITTDLYFPIFYEPNPVSMSADDLADARTGKPPRAIRRYSLGNTTGALTHAIVLTKIDIPVNDLPNEMITTRSAQRITGTFKGPKSILQALLTGGTAYLGCSTTCAALGLTQLGFRSGSCQRYLPYELTFPGDLCTVQYDAVLYAQATHADASQEVNYSSEEAANLPINLMEASSVYFKGQHSLTLQRI